jgi:alanine-glyoxylate transaminase/serine-glyoxylate transaminase/serine-pyruvate transaminase
MGPGPSDVYPSVLQALARPTLGHLDPQFLQIMDEIRALLRAAFNTTNELTMPMSGTGTAGMEACVANIVEPGDRVLVGCSGVFGPRLAEMARRQGAEVVMHEGEWGRSIPVDDLRAAAAGRSFKALMVVHAETSSGALQDLSGMRALADELGALLVVDAVTSLGGVPVDVDARGLDVVYSGSQKCLSCPPGLAPLTFTERAAEALARRTAPVSSWYLDLSLINRYWGGERAYHHTAPVNMLYGLHEALRLALEEGLEARYARHALHGAALAAGLEALGLPLPVPPAERIPQLTPVAIPDGVDDRAVRGALLAQHNLEIGGGLGPMKGRVWRIGLMGAAASRRNVDLCLAALTSALRSQGFTPRGDGLAAAAEVYGS